MTDFKITPEDVGRVAVGEDAFDIELMLLLVTDRGAVFEHLESKALYTFNLRGERTDGVAIASHRPGLKGWKPTILEAPKRWWCVWRHRENGSIHWDSFFSYPHPTEQKHAFHDLIAVVHAEHWHGCEEGRFDEPGDEVVPEDAQ